MRGVALLLAGGAGRRLGAGPKAFLELDGVPILRRAAEAAHGAALVDGIVAAVPPASVDKARRLLEDLNAEVVTGGDTRQNSAWAALEAAGTPGAVAVHDAARPLCPASLFDMCLEALDLCPAVIAAAPVCDTLKRADGGVVTDTVDRTGLWAAQTPQAFHADVYRRAHEQARRANVQGTDDASLLEQIGESVRMIEGPRWNIKITSPDDLDVARAILRAGLA